MSANGKNVDPPDKTENKNENSTVNKKEKEPSDTEKTEKFSRPRDSDDDVTDYENSEKKAKTVSDELVTKTSQSLLNKSLLDTNPFAILDSNEDTDDLAGKISRNINIKQFGGNNQSGKTAQKQRVPPINITKPFKNPKEAITNIEKMLNGKVTFKILKEGYSVLVESLEAHNTLKRFLSQQKIPFYTFTTSENKPLRLVLKGVHHSYTPFEIVEDLTAKKVNVVSVQQMYGKGKINLDMFIVNFEQGTKLAELSKTIKYVCHQSVSWQNFIKKHTGTQCRKCQRFGHAATNCGLEYRCVKCTDSHAPGDCPLENDQPATCVNCKESHPASYKKCPAYTKYVENMKKPQRQKTGKNLSNTNNVKSSIFSSKTSLVNNSVSYSQALKMNNTNKENNLNFMSNEINNLFDCTLVDLLQKMQTFVPEYKKVKDVMLKKVMIIDFLSQFT